MLELVKDYIKQNNLFENSNKIVLALSGGIDSFVLFDILKKLNYNIVIAHVNHNKRIESKKEQKDIESICLKENIEFRSVNFFHNSDTNFHNESHNFRYDFFKKICKEFNTNIVCTAHHKDDNLETIILNMMSGSNLYGYSGINKKLEVDDIFITRPLLCVTKEEIKAYAKDNNILYFEDSSNLEDDYKRNRIRHHIIPNMIKEQSNIYNKIDDFSAILLESFNFIRNNSLKYLKTWDNKINVSEFIKLDIALKKDIICVLLENSNACKSNVIIEDILRIIESNKSQSQVSLKDNLEFVKRYNESFIKEITPNVSVNQKLSLNKPTHLSNGHKMYFSENVQNICANTIRLCYNKLIDHLFVRNRVDGDYINMPYGRKKIKDLFIDLKIPKEKRDEVLMVCDDEKVLWVIGYAISQEFSLQKEHSDIFLVYEV